MFGDILTPIHLLMILIIALLVFGPGKLPQIGQGLGKSIREFKKALAGQDEEVHKVTDQGAQKDEKHLGADGK